MSPEPASLAVRHLAVVDDAGRPRIELTLDAHQQPTVRLLDRDGAEVARLGLFPTTHDLEGSGASPCGAELVLAAPGTGGHVAITVGDQGAASVELASDGQGTASIALAVEQFGELPIAGALLKVPGGQAGVDARDAKVTVFGVPAR